METSVKWDYTKLAKYYDKRAEYAPTAIEVFFKAAGLKTGDLIADIGAGTGKLTQQLLRLGLQVKAVEPNAEMRKFGSKNTQGESVEWRIGTGEKTGLENHSVKAAAFGSSFNVTDRLSALKEVRRIVTPGGWFACLWNHRDLEDPTQKEVEECIQKNIPDYQYGTRREDQRTFLENSGQFKKVFYVEGTICHTTSVIDYVDAWRSHATLQRQAGSNFTNVIAQIEKVLQGKNEIKVPYTTRLWYAQLV